MNTDDQQAVAETFRIGEAAKRTGLTTRTLRYWEELGILGPSMHRDSGERLYTPADVERATRIRELQQLLGFSLAEIRAVLETEDLIEEVRVEYRKNDDVDRQRTLLTKIADANGKLISRLDETLERIHAFRDDRAAYDKLIRDKVAELGREPSSS
jgi:DNA-binding transcriptional MerR regulator